MPGKLYEKSIPASVGIFDGKMMTKLCVSLVAVASTHAQIYAATRGWVKRSAHPDIVYIIELSRTMIKNICS